MELGPILPEAVLAATALLVVAVDLLNENRRNVMLTALVGLIATAATLFTLRGETVEAWAGTVVVDPFSLVFQAIFIGVAVLVVLTSYHYVGVRRVHTGEFYALLMTATLGMFFMASSRDLLVIYLGLETLSISSYVLAGMLKGDRSSTEASMKYFLTGALTSAVILYGISLLYGISGGTHLTGIAEAVAANEAYRLPALAAMVFLVAGFGFKAAAVPFHMWAPDVYDGAPTPVSAFLITGSEAAAFAAILRVFPIGLPGLAPEWAGIFGVIAILTMSLGNLAALLQTGIKRLMAYSAIAQAGYILSGIAVVGLAMSHSDWTLATTGGAALSATLFYILGYSFMTLGVFAGILYTARRVEGPELDAFHGLSNRAPWVAAALAVCLLSLIGMPGTVGFAGKLFILQAALALFQTEPLVLWIAVALVLNTIISVAYYTKVIRQMYLRPWKAGQEKESDTLPRLPALGAVLTIAVVVVLALGIYPTPVLGWIQAAQVALGA